MKRKETALQRAIRLAGGYAAVAQLLRMESRQAVYMWTRRRLPAEHCINLERVSGVPRHELRPDIFPRPVE